MGRIHIRKANIEKMDVDCIVNAANQWLSYGGGVCGAIFEEAGIDELQDECDLYSPIQEGEVVITGGYNLKAEHIIHAVGSVWHGGNSDEEGKLRSCYRNSMSMAQAYGAESIAFPVISSGIFGYPKDEAIRVCLEEIRNYIVKHKYNVDAYIVSTSEESYKEIKRMAKKLFRGCK